MRIASGLVLLLAACGSDPVGPVAADAGSELERAAVARGLVGDPETIDPVGVYASDSDRVCVVPAGDGYRLGASVNYGEGQSCTGRGTATGRGTLDIRLAGDCRFSAKMEADRIVFPATVPRACDDLCVGRASLAALTAARLSGSATEASGTIGPDGKPMCS